MSVTKDIMDLKEIHQIAVSDTDRGSTTLPDVEDINRDNTMNTIDSYYEYEIEISTSESK